MPTGYTADIKEGISFEDFVWNCARAFGALISMRDAPMDSEIPEKLKPSKYHLNALEDAYDEISRLERMSPEELEQEALKAFQKEEKRLNKYIQDCAELEVKYNAMLAQVLAWNPPTKDHINLKNFMMEQIGSSINFDCKTKYSEAELDKLELMSGKAWFNMKMEILADNVKYHREKHREEIDRTESRNKWIKALRESFK